MIAIHTLGRFNYLLIMNMLTRSEINDLSTLEPVKLSHVRVEHGIDGVFREGTSEKTFCRIDHSDT